MLVKTYWAIALGTCLMFAVAALGGWKAPNLGILDGHGMSGGRGTGYYHGWRGGK